MNNKQNEKILKPYGRNDSGRWRSAVFYAPEGTSGGILKSNRLSVRPSVRPSVTNRVSAISHKLLKQI